MGDSEELYAIEIARYDKTLPAVTPLQLDQMDSDTSSLPPDAEFRLLINEVRRAWGAEEAALKEADATFAQSTVQRKRRKDTEIERDAAHAARADAEKRIAELEQQLAAAQADLASLREPVAGLRLTREEVSRFGIQDFEAGELLADLRAAHRIIAQQREQLASRDAWVRTADRLPTEADAPHGVEVTRSIVDDWARMMCRVVDVEEGYWTHWRALPAPPADDEGGDDAQQA